MRTPLRLLATSIGLASLLGTLPAHARLDTPFSQKPFTDVSTSHANYAAIEYLRTNNVLKGYLDGTFKPSRRMTRAEFVALLTNPFFLKGTRTNDCLKVNFSENSTRVFFRDVRRDSEAAQDICEAVVHDIIRGYPDGTFKPNDYITFIEGAKVVLRVLSITVQTGQAGDPQWYVSYVRRLAELKAIPRTITRLTKPITRGEMAEIVYRIKTATTTKSSMRYEDFAQ